MFDLDAELREREDPIRVGVVGTGAFGTKFIEQSELVSGMTTVAVADVDESRARAALERAGVADEQVVVVDGVDDASAEIDSGNRALFDDGTDLAAIDLDVVVEATGVVDAGARHAYAAIMAGTHVVMATVEVDVVVGPILAELAENNGVVYSMAYGDQPALAVELCNWARTIGLDVVAAGKGAGSHDWNEAVEMCAIANATGLKPDNDGMHHPRAALSELPELFRPVADGGILERTGVVDTVLHPEGPEAHDVTFGEFVVTCCENETVGNYVNNMGQMGAYATEDNRYHVFFRPHHLPGTETTVSVASVVLRGQPTGSPRGHEAEVVARTRDEMHSETDVGRVMADDSPVHGTLVDADFATERNLVPFGLLDDARLTVDVSGDEYLTYDDVDLDESFVASLRRLQDGR